MMDATRMPLGMALATVPLDPRIGILDGFTSSPLPSLRCFAIDERRRVEREIMRRAAATEAERERRRMVGRRHLARIREHLGRGA